MTSSVGCRCYRLPTTSSPRVALGAVGRSAAGGRRPWVPGTRGARHTCGAHSCRLLSLVGRVAPTSILWLSVVLLSPCLMTTGSLTAQTVRGLVLERVTDRPIELGRVALVEAGGDTVAVATSDARGFFSVTTEDPGHYHVLVEAFGYRLESAGPFELDLEELRVVQINLEPAPVEVQGIDVEAEETATPYLVRQGFTERRKMGFGHFVGPQELDDFRTIVSSTEDIFYRFAGVTLGPQGPMMIGSTGRTCGPAVLLDGVRTTERIPPLEQLEAIEIYTRAVQVPLQYSWAAQGCGVILYWTKH